MFDIGPCVTIHIHMKAPWSHWHGKLFDFHREAIKDQGKIKRVLLRGPAEAPLLLEMLNDWLLAGEIYLRP